MLWDAVFIWLKCLKLMCALIIGWCVPNQFGGSAFQHLNLCRDVEILDAKVFFRVHHQLSQQHICFHCRYCTFPSHTHTSCILTFSVLTGRFLFLGNWRWIIEKMSTDAKKRRQECLHRKGHFCHFLSRHNAFTLTETVLLSGRVFSIKHCWLS